MLLLLALLGVGWLVETNNADQIAKVTTVACGDALAKLTEDADVLVRDSARQAIERIRGE